MSARCTAHGSDAGAVAYYVAAGGREVYEHRKGAAYHSGGRAFAEREHAWPLLEPQAVQGELSQRLPSQLSSDLWRLPHVADGVHVHANGHQRRLLPACDVCLRRR
ncbi:hypothetical protein CERSUDRAFT_101600 [Gelatoporia subvermispora B]|uniref:Uncharacterized protein n=1 Tax=Ceriporiopsis subvermispora (strain B) TaxID=914234 RepID=M2Q0B0_CERS8|nr:hypothetical protein CERSUDRAFT_101600 [Gelatoporia subvermispora B]